MNYYYSAKNNAFYPYELKKDYINAGSWPDDVIEVDESIFSDFSGNMPPKGKVRIAGDDGLPAWADIPPPTQEELCQHAEVKKIKLMEYAKDIISPLQDAVDLGINTNAEKSALIEWRKYRVILNRIDCNVAPDIEWPVQPK
ncbi:tail fiber assembly protein [Xenorhabdus anantnagensis]|uniref:Tail fiber assembly protein n=1 Tax=Xenorhabdus anantnagensis TaxID=3025875 RepID=A0ABT5LX20_9GAMM|nr:tail fiber assembly protein [Xenorhabdus anantnagensis]MDC9598995.1 tail fiber assembly protein [Xenorhabdus anantnagensis]